VRELTLISSTIKSHPKHDSSGDMTIPVCLSGEKKLQINRQLLLVSYQSYSIDQQILSQARYNHTNPSAAHR